MNPTPPAGGRVAVTTRRAVTTVIHPAPDPGPAPGSDGGDDFEADQADLVHPDPTPVEEE